MKKQLFGAGMALLLVAALAATVLQTDVDFGGTTDFYSPAKYKVTLRTADNAIFVMDFVNYEGSPVATNFSNPIYFSRTGIVGTVIAPAGAAVSSQTLFGTNSTLAAFTNSAAITIGLPLTYTTNANVQVADFSVGYSLFATNAAFTFGAASGVTTVGQAQSTVVLVTNSTAAAVLITFPASIKTQGTLYVTNVTACSFFTYAGLFTNCTVLPLW